MKMPSREYVDSIRKQYPVGTRVELIHLDDPYNWIMKPGCKGTVRHVDDVATVFVDWDCGSSLGLIPDVDDFKIITEEDDAHD